ncbi:MAG TPA: hypothetical protein VG733_14495 [Chthoniobacteraceae bacterium]|nr:hypothetical protein [Chthoniobacteraceae bacterium]
MPIASRLNKIVQILAILSSAVVFADPPSGYTIDDNGAVLVGPERKNYNSLSEKERTEFLSRIRLQLDDSDYRSRFQASQLLLILNDEESMGRMIDMYHAGTLPFAFENLRTNGREAIIPWLIPDIYKDHGGMVEIPGYASLEAKEAAACLVLSSIQNSQNLPAGSRSWAKELNLNYGSREIDENQEIVLIKEWWAHNKEAITARQYDKATWIPKLGLLNKWIFNHVNFDGNVLAIVSALIFVVAAWLLFRFGNVLKRR